MPYQKGQLAIVQLNTINTISKKLTEGNFNGYLNRSALDYLEAKKNCSTDEVLHDLDQWRSEVKTRMKEGCQIVAAAIVTSLSQDDVIDLDRSLQKGKPISLSERLTQPTRKINRQQANRLFRGYSVIEDRCICQAIRTRAQEITSRRDKQINDETALVAFKCANFVLHDAYVA